MNTSLSPITCVGSSWANTLLAQLQTVSPLQPSATMSNIVMEPVPGRPVGIAGRTFRRLTSGLGYMFRPVVLAAGALFLASCPSSMSYLNIEYSGNGKKWAGQIILRSPCTDTRQPPTREWLQMMRRTCSGKIDHDVVKIRQCGPCSWEWDVELFCNSVEDPLD